MVATLATTAVTVNGMGTNMTVVDMAPQLLNLPFANCSRNLRSARAQRIFFVAHSPAKDLRGIFELAQDFEGRPGDPQRGNHCFWINDCILLNMQQLGIGLAGFYLKIKDFRFQEKYDSRQQVFLNPDLTFKPVGRDNIMTVISTFRRNKMSQEEIAGGQAEPTFDISYPQFRITNISMGG